MNKLGFYIENTTVQFLRDALRQVRPPTILLHAGDRGLLREIRSTLSPDTFVIGRIFVDLHVQEQWLDSDDPEQRGRDFADRIIDFDFGLALERGANDRLLIDAWMSLNEIPRGPASYPNYQVDDEYRRRAAAYDRFQVAFREQLQSAGLEAVAFNFAAGNFTRPEHYRDWFPGTLESYRYLGFHEYGWPTLMEDPAKGTATSATFYRPVMEGIRQQYGDRHQVIITEAGLARMYKYPRDEAGDVGWLYPGETISEGQYWESLRWYNCEMAKDDYVLGCCLFQVGHSGRWETFRHLGQDNQQQPILLISKIATLNDDPTHGCGGESGGNGSTGGNGGGPEPGAVDLEELQARIATLIDTLEPAERQAGEQPDALAAVQQELDDLARRSKGMDQMPSVLTGLLARVSVLQATAAQPGDGDLDALRARLDEIEAELTAAQPAANQAVALPGQVAQARSQAQALAPQAAQATALHPQFVDLLDQARSLKAQANALAGGAVSQPELDDVRATLPQHPTKRYPTRPTSSIRRLIVHHTATRDNVTPELVASFHVNQGLAGIKYHFMIDGSGSIFWTQPLEAILPQTEASLVNQDGVAVSLAGRFDSAVPKDAQMDAAARLIAWLLSDLRLSIDAVYGRSELDGSVSSPGTQWLQGARYKDTLLSKVAALLAASL